MSWLVFDIVLCLIVYAILLAIFIRKSRRKRDFGDDDGEGGIPATLPPDFDLPPGICLPDDPRVKVKEPEDVLV